MSEKFDSRIDTYEHIAQVRKFLDYAIDCLMTRSRNHDRSKLVSPEVEVFDEFTPKLKATTYGSDEYKAFLAAMKPALDHHYRVNRHHPEHFERGIRGMTLIDLLEMLCDWYAATMRHSDGSILRSIEVNQERFGYTDELKDILKNTMEEISGSVFRQ